VRRNRDELQTQLFDLDRQVLVSRNQRDEHSAAVSSLKAEVNDLQLKRRQELRFSTSRPSPLQYLKSSAEWVRSPWIGRREFHDS
jgi:hypothetical protein